MLPLKGRNVVVIGASGGVGRRIVAFTIRAGARVLAVARQAQPLQQLAHGYAGAKRTQVFIASYAQKESDRLGLDLRFTVLAPCLVPGTELGGHIASGYARYLGMTEAEFDACLQAHPTSSDIAKAVVELAVGRRRSKATVFIVSENGLEAKAP